MKTVLLLDGGYLRATAQNAGVNYDVQFIENFSRRCFDPNEYLLRILYYDAPQYDGVVQLPVSGKNKMFKSKDTLLDDLAELERFACRKGSLGFRGWKRRSIPIAGGSPLTDSDFQPVFEQKGVDMRVDLDIAEFANRRSVDRIILVTGDTDMIPAMKHARKAGVEVVIAELPAPARRIHDDLLRHADLVRAVIL